MGDYGRLSNFNPDANFSLVRYGGNTPITELELNETQMLLSNRIKALSQSVIGDRFLEGGVINLDTTTNEFTITNQLLINQGRELFISSLRDVLIDNETVYLDIYEQEITKDSTIKRNGNLQESSTVENTLLDPRLEGIETARRMQTCFDLVKEVSRFEFETTEPIIKVGEHDYKTVSGKYSKIVRIEGNVSQSPDTPNDLKFVGDKQEDGSYLIPITSTNNNMYNLNRKYLGCEYAIEENSLILYPTTPNSWSGLSTFINVKPNTVYNFSCEVKGKYMIHIKDSKGTILAMGNQCVIDTKENSVLEIVFHSGCGETTQEVSTVFSNIVLSEGVYRSYVTNEASTITLSLPCHLAKVGDYKDYLYTNALGNWVVEKNTIDYSFNGKEIIDGKGWEKILEGETTIIYQLKGFTNALSNSQTFMTSNYAIGTNANYLLNNEIVGCSLNTSGTIQVRLSKELAPSLEVFKSLLLANNLEVTMFLPEPKILEGEVEVLGKVRTASLEKDNTVSTFRYDAEGNVITLQDTRNGFTNKVYIEGNSIVALPLNTSDESTYTKYNAEQDTYTNENGVDYRDMEEVEVLCNLETNTTYTVTFKALNNILCEISCLEESPTIMQEEVYTKTFNSGEHTEFKLKIWSPTEEGAVSIKDLRVFYGTVTEHLDTKDFLSVGDGTQGLYLVSKIEGTEIDRQPLMYNYRGKMLPITHLPKLPNGVCDTIEEHEDGKYYYHKRVLTQNLTSRMKLEEVEKLENGNIVVAFNSTVANFNKDSVYSTGLQVVENSQDCQLSGVEVTEEGRILLSVPMKSLKTKDKYGVSKMLNNLDITLYMAQQEEVVYECNMFDVMTKIGNTTVELECGDLNPNKFSCEFREYEGVNVNTFNNNTFITFETEVAPSKVGYVAHFKASLPEQEGHVYVPLATRVGGQLKDLRIFDPNIVDFVNEEKDLTTGVYTVVKALRQNGTLKYKSILSEKDDRGNYNLMTIRYYDALGKVNYRTEKYCLKYDLEGDLISKELVKQW